MKDDPVFYTESMAALCARQGYFEKSAQIYRYLLERDPGRDDLAKALAEVENAMQKPGQDADGQPGNRLESLIETWITLLVESNIQKKFDEIREGIKRMTP
ncbi:MAG: hypothetical protein DRH32_06865 [Deltaproteobacteria bacterium]|nr:MAG: hypothetical protein DRH32_06865 [Deltaproteobacteria bacterium]